MRTIVNYERSAMVEREVGGGYDVRGGGYGGRMERFQVVETTESPTKQLEGEYRLIKLTKVTTTVVEEEVFPKSR